MEIALENNMLCLIIEPEAKLNINNILEQGLVKEAITVHQFWCYGNNTYVKYDYEKEDCNLLYNIYGDINILKYLAYQINRLHADRMRLEQLYKQDEKGEK